MALATRPKLLFLDEPMVGMGAAAASSRGGEQQMLAIARALMTNPDLLILDEATEGLAPLIRLEIWLVLETLKARGQSILVIDKNVEALARIADRHYIMEKGTVVWSGDSEALAGNDELKVPIWASDHKSYRPCRNMPR